MTKSKSDFSAKGMIVTKEEFDALEPNMLYPDKLPPLFEQVFLWTGSEWLITYLWVLGEDNYRWNNMGAWGGWPIWVKIKQPPVPGSALSGADNG